MLSTSVMGFPLRVTLGFNHLTVHSFIHWLTRAGRPLHYAAPLRVLISAIFFNCRQSPSPPHLLADFIQPSPFRQVQYRCSYQMQVLVANSSSRALRPGSLCKPTHKRRLWQLCLSGALQILDFWLIEWLIAYLWPTLSGDVEVIFY